MPLEECLMDHCCIGRLIEDNDCKNNKKFNVFCDFCEEPMTEKPLTYYAARSYNTLFAHAHYTGLNDHILSLMSDDVYDAFVNVAREGKKFKIIRCKGINERSKYEKIYKAILADYNVPKTDLQNTMIRTNQVYVSLFEVYLDRDMYPKFLERALRGSVSSLIMFKKEMDFPPGFVQFMEKHHTKTDYITHEKAIVEKIIGPTRPRSWKEDGKPTKRFRKTTEKEKLTRKKEFRYSASALKTNWKTIMPYNESTWHPKRKKPHCAINVIIEPGEIHYIGRADIKNDKVYFFVHDDMITDEKPVFTQKWLKQLVENVEHDITEQQQKTLIRQVRLFKGHVIDYVKLVEIENGVHKHVGKQNNGHFDDLTQEWIDENFKVRFPIFYGKIMDEKHIGVLEPTPSGAIDVDESDSSGEEDMPNEFATDGSAHYRIENTNVCAFGNMANALALLNDNIASQFFFDNRDGDIDTLRDKHTKTENKVPINMFHLARDIVRHQFGYGLKYVKHHDLIELAEKHKNDMIYVEIHAVQTAFQHVVCIKGNIIYDGCLETALKCSEEAVQWLIKEEHYNFIAYIIEVTKKVQRRINFEARK